MSCADGPPASGVPVPGANAGIHHVDVEADEGRPIADSLPNAGRRPPRTKPEDVLRGQVVQPKLVRRPVQSSAP